MIKVTDLETKLYVEQIYGESCSLYVPETFSEWETYESTKQDVYNAIWNSVQTFYDIWEMSQRGVFQEAAPTRDDDADIKEVPDVARKKVLISNKMAYLGLPQVPRQAAVGLLSNNMVSSNPDYFRYIGKGFFGALQDRSNGQEPQNWVKEIRYVLQSRPSAPYIIDPETLKAVPRLGAITNRPVKEGVPQVPPDWNEYAPRKANAFTDEETGQQYHGVYIGYQDTIKQLETPLGQRIQLTQGGDRIAPAGTKEIKDKDGNIAHTLTRNQDIKIRTDGRGITRGQVQADLRPPIGADQDPNANSFLGSPATDSERAVPPMAAGYKPQSLATSNALQRQFGQYKYYMTQNPELFDRRLLNVLIRKQLQDRQNYQDGKISRRRFTPELKGQIPLRHVPITRNVPRTEPYDPDNPDWGRARRYKMVPDPDKPGKMKRVAELLPYYRRMWIPDPTEPARSILAKPAQKEYTPEEREKEIERLEKRFDAVGAEYKKIAGEIKKVQGSYGNDQSKFTRDEYWNMLVKDAKDARVEINRIAAFIDNLTKGHRVDYNPKKIGKFGSERIPYTPEEIEKLKANPVNPDTGKPIKNLYRFLKAGKLKKDGEGNTIPRTTMGAVRQVVLPNNYFLSPVQGDPIVLSPELRDEAMKVQARLSDESKDGKSDGLYNTATAIAERTKNPGDKVFVANVYGYGLKVDKHGQFYSSTLGEKANKIPWSWARTDDKGNLMYIYKKDTKTRDIPVYLPGVVDSRKPNNPTTAGGWDAAPANAPETRPVRDPRRRSISMTGIDPENKKPVKSGFYGYENEMYEAAQAGIKAGFAELRKRQLKNASSKSGSGKDHPHYKYLMSSYGYDALLADSIQYMIYNLRNSKTLDFITNNTGHLDREFIKKKHLALYAAIQKFDKWFNTPTSKGTTPREMMRIPKKSLWDLTLVQWGEFLERAKKITYLTIKKDDGTEAGAGYAGIGKVKIDSRYIKKGLTPYKMGNDKTTQYTGSNTAKQYQHLLLSIRTLEELFNEARRNYWMDAAKDMVIKVWQHNKKDIDAATQMGDSENSGVDDVVDKDGERQGLTRSSTVEPGQQVYGRMSLPELHRYIKQRQQQLNDRVEALENDPNAGSTMDSVVQMMALKMQINQSNLEHGLLEQIEQESRELTSANKEQKEKWIADQYYERLDAYLKQKPTKIKRTAEEPEVNDTPRTLDDFFAQAPNKGLSDDPEWKEFSQKIQNANSTSILDVMEDFSKRVLELKNPKMRTNAERTVSYHILKDLQANAQNLTPERKKFFLQLSYLLKREFSTLYDASEFIPHIIQIDAPQPSPQGDSAPKGGSGLGSRLKRKAV